MAHNTAEEALVQRIPERPYLLALSCTDRAGLLDNIDKLCDDLWEEDAELLPKAQDLSSRRDHEAYRAFAVTRDLDVESEDFEDGKTNSPGKICLLFTGQGSQWPQMGQDLLETFPIARQVVDELHGALQRLADPPSWSLFEELTELRSIEHYSHPEIAQTLTTAVQIALVAVYRHWGVKFDTVIGHSSGEIAAACTAGLLSRSEAIATAYYCGWSASKAAKSEGRTPFSTGMLAAAADARDIEKVLKEETIEQVEIACYNGPEAVTLSGPMPALKRVEAVLAKQGRRTSVLNNPVAYHHPRLMAAAGQVYESKLKKVLPSGGARTARKYGGWPMLSTVTTNPTTTTAAADATYWKNNILSAVRFEETLTKALSGPTAPTILIELGPSAALSGSVKGIKAKVGAKAADVAYYKSMSRGKAAIVPMFQTAGGLFLSGADIDLARVNH
ncbi:hypothetical protein DL764_001494 [Monosporascus ibericus]|uniref:Malonyl-CoA:ACP transacylase (MAT) domain-containing protein n=1 Tax=Monosporascus ibericus TaxID=155417 RepID=A0A4Q4TU97_9PEZI|nr:hypothetical protein DL764_001494 [Monosporascus ibericus]